MQYLKISDFLDVSECQHSLSYKRLSSRLGQKRNEVFHLDEWCKVSLFDLNYRINLPLCKIG